MKLEILWPEQTNSSVAAENGLNLLSAVKGARMERIRRDLILTTFLSGLERFASFSHLAAGTHQASDLPRVDKRRCSFSKRLSPL